MSLRPADLLSQGLRGLVGIATYARMTLVPRPVTGVITVAPPQGLTDPRILVGLAVVVALLGALLWLRRAHPPAAFALGWYVFALLPPSNLLPIYGEKTIHVAERSLYPSLAGWCLFLVVGLHALGVATRGGPQRYRVPQKVIGVAVLATFLAITFVKAGAWRNDVTLWTAALAWAPNSPVLQANLSTALAEAGDLEGTQGVAREAAARFPADPHIAFLGGQIAELRGDSRQALREYERAIALGPHLGTAYRQAAAMAAREREWERAGRWFAEGEARFPKDVWPHVGLAWYREREGRADLPRAHLERAARLEPNAPEREWFLGQLYATEGRVGKAMQASQAALALDPSFLPARLTLASVLEEEGRIAEAIDGWRGIAASLPAGKQRDGALDRLHRLEAMAAGRRAPGGSR